MTSMVNCPLPNASFACTKNKIWTQKKKDYSFAVMHPQVPWTSQWSSGSIKLDNWLVVGLPLWKIWKSVGMMTFPIYGKIKMFQTTNQIISQEVSARFELHSMASPISMTIYIYNYIMMKLNSIIHQKMCVCSYWFASPRVSGNIMDIQQMFFPQVRFKKNSLRSTFWIQIL